MADSFVDFFDKLGFTKSETNVYLALLKLGSEKASAIAKRANVSRSKIYEVLEKLIEKGLVSFIFTDGVKYFEAQDPKNVGDFIQSEKDRIERYEKEFKNIFSKLNALREHKAINQDANVMKGYNGIKFAYNDILNSMRKGQEYYAYAIEGEKYSKEFSIFIKNYHRKRQEKGINVKLLSNVALKKEILKDVASYKYSQIKFTSQSLPTSTLIYGHKVFLFVWDNEITTIMINSKDIAKQYKAHFLDLWKTAKK